MLQISKILLCCFVFILGACADLKEEPVQQFRTSYFKDLGSLRSAINGSYRMFIADNWERSVQVASFRVPLMGADDFTTFPGGNKEDWRQYDQFYASSGNSRVANVSWAFLYDVIRQTTWDIEGAQALRSTEDPEMVNELVASSHFLRGWSYFWLVRLFGDVPLIDFTTFSNEIYQVKRSPQEDVYDFIIEEFQFAEQHLVDDNGTLYGLPTKWVAKSYLAEVHLTMAGWPLKLTENYAIAKDYAKDVLDNGPFSLLDNFGDIFLQANEGNAELIWVVPLCFETDCGGGFSGSWMSKGTKPSELNGWDDMFLEISFYERFPEGARKDFTIMDRLKVETGNPLDPFYIRENGDSVHFNYIGYENFTRGNPYMKKYWDGFYDSTLVANDVLQNTASQSALDLPMMRLAKVQLMYAEAQARAEDGANAESYEYLNQIRRRGKGYPIDSIGTEVDIPVGSLDTDAFAREVVDEKGWELLGELNRWFDLTRTERVEEVNALRSSDEALQVVNPITKDFYLAPIPAIERALNPELTQNPGYN